MFGEWYRTIHSEETSLYIVPLHKYMSTLRIILLNIEEIFTFVWINAVADYFCSTVSRITELSMKGILSMWMAHSHYDKWALFRTQWSPCWVYWTKCSILLCKVIGPINASKSLKKSEGKKEIQHQKGESLFATCHPLTDFILLQIVSGWTFNGNESLVLVRLILKPRDSWFYSWCTTIFFLKTKAVNFLALLFINFHWVLIKQTDFGQDLFWDWGQVDQKVYTQVSNDTFVIC